MKNILFKIFVLVILSAAVFKNGSLQAQTFTGSVYDSLTINANWTWIKLPTGVSAVEVNADSAAYVQVAFTTYGDRTKQRKDSVNIVGKINRGQTKQFIGRDNDSVGFKGSGKIYYWVHRGYGVPNVTFKNSKDTAYNAVTNFPSSFDFSKARWDSLYAMLNTLNKQNGTDSVFMTNSSVDWSKARWDSLYAMLNTLNKQNGTDTVFMVNAKDTLSFIDTLKNGDSLRTRTVVGYKFVIAYMQSSAGTDSVEVSAYDARQNKYALLAVYDQYLDAKYQLMIPGINIFRSYLINSPNIRIIRYRRTNTTNLTNLTIITTVCIRN